MGCKDLPLKQPRYPVLMPDLNLGPAPERNRTPAILISIAVLAIVAAAIYCFSPRHPTQVRVEKVDIFAPHTEVKAAKGGVHILGTPSYAEDNLYVVVHVSIENKLGLPITLEPPEAAMTTPAGVIAATIVSPVDVARLEQSFPELTPLATNPIGDDSQVAPHSTLEGSIILLYPTLRQTDWQTKKSASLTLNFLRIESQTVDLK
jgi:hypothetical protein